MKNDQKNFLLFAVLAALVLFGWPYIANHFFPAANPPVTKLEDGKSTITPGDLDSLLDLYGVKGDERSAVLALAAEARKRAFDAESEELARLQQRADEQLAQLGPRPMAELERLYDELTRRD